MNQPGGEVSSLVGLRNEPQLSLESFEKFRGMEDVPRRNHRGVTELTFPGVSAIVVPVGGREHRVGETAKITPADVLGPSESFLPVHPTYFVGVGGTPVSPMLVDHAARRPTVTAHVMTRTVVVMLDTAHKTTRIASHEVFDRFAVFLSCRSTGVGGISGDQGLWGRLRRGLEEDRKSVV